MRYTAMFDNPRTKNASFFWIASAALSIVVLGFCFTYWKLVFAGETFPVVLHIHAALWFGWFALLVAQTVLIQKRKRQLHKRMGIAAVFYTTVLIVFSLMVAFQAIARDVHLITRSLESVPTIIPLTQILMFAVLFGLAVIKRNQCDIHKSDPRW